jgi:hypothetical protein
MLAADGSERARLERLTLALVHGVVIDAANEPAAIKLGNTPAVRRRMALCKERLAYYRSIDAVELLVLEPDLLQPLHVVVREGKKDRLVIDLSRNLNDELHTPSFHLSSFQDLVRQSSPGCFYGKLDLSDCFLSFDVHPDSQKFLAFELDGRFFRWKRLPFGLKSSPFWCEEFLSVIDFALRARGILFTRYVDDFAFVGATAADVLHAMQTARSILAAHGLRVNEKKTEGPVQRMTFLGLGIDSVLQECYVPQDKLTGCKGLLKAALKKITAGTPLQRHDVQSLVGKLSFISAVLPGSRPFFRHLIEASAGLPHRHSPLVRSPEIEDDLVMWLNILRKWPNGTCGWQSKEPEVEFFHDASKDKSDGGFGFFLGALPPDTKLLLPCAMTAGHAFAGSFPPDVLGPKSIQWAELFAMVYALSLYAPYLRGRSVLLWSDNMADVFIINKQKTRCPHLLALLRALYATAAHYRIRIRAQHIRGRDNILADLLSRAALHLNRTHVSLPNCPTTTIHHICSSSWVPPSALHLPASTNLRL